MSTSYFVVWPVAYVQHVMSNGEILSTYLSYVNNPAGLHFKILSHYFVRKQKKPSDILLVSDTAQ